MAELTHFNQAGEAHMVDVGDKAVTQRKAVASGRIIMLPETLKLIEQGNHKKVMCWGLPASLALWRPNAPRI